MKKDESIETLRGIAVLFLISAHIIGSNSSKGIHVDDESFFRYFYYIFSYIRMPLFTVISGYVYAIRPVKKGYERKFMLGKSRRILLPMIFVSSLQYITMAVVPGTNKEVNIGNIYKIYISGFDQFWFLQAIFLVFVTITILEILLDMDIFRNWLIILLISCLLFIFAPAFPFFSFSGYLYLLPFFLIGIGLNRFNRYILKKEYIYFFLAIFTLGIILQHLSWFKLIDINDNKRSLISLSVGITSIVVLFYYRKANIILAKLGYYSYGIYLFHIFGTAGTRIIFTKLFNVDNHVVLFFSCLIMGVFSPIFIEYILEKNSRTAFIFLGKRIKSIQ